MSTSFPSGVDSFTTKVDRGVVYHTDINNLQDAVMALETFLRTGVQGAFNVKSAEFGAVGNGTTDDSAAINLAIAAANAVTTSGVTGIAAGATVFFPPGLYKCSSQLTRPGPNVRLLGAGGRVWSTSQPGASVLLMGFVGDLFDLGNGLTNNVSFTYLGIDGNKHVTSGASLSHRGIYSASCAGIWIHGCSLTGFGGPAIQIDAGLGKWITHTQTTHTLMAYADLVALGVQRGGVQVAGVENNMFECNFNGPAFTDSTLGEYGSGYAAAVYTNGAPNTWYKVVGAYAQVGICLGASVGSSYGSFVYCRGEFNQGHGWVNLGGDSNNFSGCISHDNNRATATPTYSGFFFSGTATGRNNFTDCVVSGTHATYKVLYGFTDVNNGAGNTFINANHYNAGCLAPGVDATGRRFNPTYGAAIPIIQGQNWTQAGSLNTTPSPDELTFDGESGNIWRAAIASGTATLLKASNLLPGQIYTLYIVQPASAGTVTLDTVFAKMAAFTSPANSRQLTGQFYSDGTSLYQVGAWSGDMA
jgi:hypothetical protein